MQGYMPYLSILLLIILSAFFSGSEIAYASANRLRLKRAAERGNPSGRTAFRIYENYQDALSTILIGNNLVNIAASAVATVIAINLFGDIGAAYATAIMTVLIIIFGEILPKILAKEHSDGFALGVALPLRALMWLTKPIVWLVGKMIRGLTGALIKNPEDEHSMTDEELTSIIETVEDEGLIDEERSELLQSAIEFADITAQEIVTPRVDLAAIDIDDDMDEILRIADEADYSRLPVYQGTIDNIIGILILNHLYRAMINEGEIDLRALLMPPCYLHKTMKLPKVLEELKRRQTHIAVVTDEYGGTLGVLTMEDVLEQLVGDIWDESDEIITEFEQTGDNEYIAGGDMSVYDLFERLDLSDRELDGDYISAGGWAISMLGGFPSEGDCFEYQNITVTIKELSDLRVTKLQITVAPQEEADTL